MIEIRDLNFSYSETREIFNGLNFLLRKGDRVGLIGPNGAGKTTLFYLIMGLLKPNSGKIRVCGEARESEIDFDEVRQKIGLLFQDTEDQLFCPTVEEDIAFGPLNLGKSHREAEVIVKNVCKDLGINGFEREVTSKLSGGQKRLVALATIMAMNPECLLLDEPATGLDKDTVDKFLRYLRKYSDTYIIITHNYSFLNDAVDKIYILKEHKIEPYSI